MLLFWKSEMLLFYLCRNNLITLQSNEKTCIQILWFHFRETVKWLIAKSMDYGFRHDYCRCFLLDGYGFAVFQRHETTILGLRLEPNHHRSCRLSHYVSDIQNPRRTYPIFRLQWHPENHHFQYFCAECFGVQQTHHFTNQPIALRSGFPKIFHHRLSLPHHLGSDDYQPFDYSTHL